MFDGDAGSSAQGCVPAENLFLDDAAIMGSMVQLQPKAKGGGIVPCTAVVRKTIDPGIPELPGRITSGFHRPGRRCVH